MHRPELQRRVSRLFHTNSSRTRFPAVRDCDAYSVRTHHEACAVKRQNVQIPHEPPRIPLRQRHAVEPGNLASSPMQASGALHTLCQVGTREGGALAPRNGLHLHLQEVGKHL